VVVVPDEVVFVAHPASIPADNAAAKRIAINLFIALPPHFFCTDLVYCAVIFLSAVTIYHPLFLKN
jgi:hypothetical protein